MNHIHICLVSDQPIPNLTTALQFRPDAVLLLYTEDVKAKKNRLKAVLSNHQIKTEERVILPYNLQNVIQVCDGVLTDYPDADLSLNITGGTKISTLGAFQVFYSANKPIWYVNTRDHQIQQVSPQTNSLPITAKIGIKDYLAAYGFSVSGWQKDEDEIQKRRPITQYLIHIATENERLIGELNRALFNINELQLPCMIELPGHPKMEELAKMMDQAGLAKRTGSSLTVTTIEMVNFLRGFWFEEYVYTLAVSIGVDEVKLNVTGTWDADVKRPPANEFDVMIAKGTQVALISCKTAYPDRTEKGEKEAVSKEFLYELNSLSDNALGLFGKRMLASARPISNQYVRDRASVMRLELVDGKNILTLKDKLQSWLSK